MVDDHGKILTECILDWFGVKEEIYAFFTILCGAKRECE
jgi:hypothetical protein